jgi:hypothetical protein
MGGKHFFFDMNKNRVTSRVTSNTEKQTEHEGQHELLISGKFGCPGTLVG